MEKRGFTMKKVMALLLAGSMTAALTACGGNSGAGGTTETTQAAAAATTEAAKEESKETSAAETAASGENYVFKFALQNGENHPLCQGVAKFGEILEEKSDGRKSVIRQSTVLWNFRSLCWSISGICQKLFLYQEESRASI